MELIKVYPLGVSRESGRSARLTLSRKNGAFLVALLARLSSWEIAEVKKRIEHWRLRRIPVEMSRASVTTRVRCSRVRRLTRVRDC